MQKFSTEWNEWKVWVKTRIVLIVLCIISMVSVLIAFPCGQVFAFGTTLGFFEPEAAFALVWITGIGMGVAFMSTLTMSVILLIMYKIERSKGVSTIPSLLVLG